MKRPRVLLVEDDIDDAAIVEREYSITDFFEVTETVRTVEETLAYLEGRGAYADRQNYRAPDIVLLDMKLGLGSGLEVIRAVRNHEELKRLPIVAFAASASQQDVDSAYAAGINSYVVKPTEAAQHSETLRAIGRYWSQCAIIPSSAA